MHFQVHTNRSSRNTIRMLRHIPKIQILQLVETLQYPHDREPRQRQCVLLSQTDSRAAVEGQELPACFAAYPALRFEFFDVWAPDVCSVVHDVYGVVDFDTLADVDGGLLVGSTSNWKASVLRCSATIEWDGCVQTQGFGHGVLEIGAGLEGREGEILGLRIGAEAFYDFLPKLVEDVRVSGQRIENPTQSVFMLVSQELYLGNLISVIPTQAWVITYSPAVVSRPASRMLRSWLRNSVGSRVALTSSWRKTYFSFLFPVSRSVFSVFWSGFRARLT